MSQTPSISVTRSISKVDEMTLAQGEYTLTAQVEFADGKARSINNGQVTETESGGYIGAFNAHQGGAVSLSIQNVPTREGRAKVFDAVETFAEAVYAIGA